MEKGKRGKGEKGKRGKELFPIGKENQEGDKI